MNFDPLFDSGAPSGADHFDVLFDSAPKGANHFDVCDFGIHAKCPSRLDRPGLALRCLLRNRNFAALCGEPTAKFQGKTLSAFHPRAQPNVPAAFTNALDFPGFFMLDRLALRLKNRTVGCLG
jgi:hypothetical protein